MEPNLLDREKKLVCSSSDGTSLSLRPSKSEQSRRHLRWTSVCETRSHDHHLKRDSDSFLQKRASDLCSDTSTGAAATDSHADIQTQCCLHTTQRFSSKFPRLSTAFIKGRNMTKNVSCRQLGNWVRRCRSNTEAAHLWLDRSRWPAQLAPGRRRQLDRPRPRPYFVRRRGAVA